MVESIESNIVETDVAIADWIVPHRAIATPTVLFPPTQRNRRTLILKKIRRREEERNRALLDSSSLQLRFVYPGVVHIIYMSSRYQ